MARKLKSDKLLFMATFLLICTSVVMVYSASAMLADARYQQQYWFLVKQGTWTILGMALLLVAMRIDYRRYGEPVVIWTAVGVVGLALVAVLFSAPINGARRWLGLGGAGIQPSEAAKLAAIFFTAAILARRMDYLDRPRYALLPVVLLVGLFTMLIVAEPDYGTAVSLLVIVGVMVFTAGLSYRTVFGLAAVSVPVLTFALWVAPYRRARLLAFLNPWEDPLGDGFQIIQSLVAVGTGGIAGRGLMGGVQKLFYLPEPHTDFIYAVIGEELGLVGTTAILLCFAVIAWRGLRAALRAPDRFGALLAVGLTTMIVFQALVNISVVLGMMPTKGIPLPFVSAGGSSLLISLMGMGILLNVSQHALPASDA